MVIEPTSSDVQHILPNQLRPDMVAFPGGGCQCHQAVHLCCHCHGAVQVCAELHQTPHQLCADAALRAQVSRSTFL